MLVGLVRVAKAKKKKHIHGERRRVELLANQKRAPQRGNVSSSSSQAPYPKADKKRRSKEGGTKGVDVADDDRNAKGRDVTNNDRDTREEGKSVSHHAPPNNQEAHERMEEKSGTRELMDDDDDNNDVAPA